MGNRSTLFAALRSGVGVLLLVFALVFSPLLSVCYAEEVKIPAVRKGVVEKIGSVPVLEDHKKDVVHRKVIPEKGRMVEKKRVVSRRRTVRRRNTEGWTTWQKVGIGAGAVAVVGVAAAAMGGGGSSSSEPAMPTSEDLLGVWRSVGTSLTDHRTYSGTYDFYSIGNHTYDIIVSTGEHKRGRGTWLLEEGTKILHVRNDTGSHYVGEFEGENFKHILLRTTNGRWQVVLDKI